MGLGIDMLKYIYSLVFVLGFVFLGCKDDNSAESPVGAKELVPSVIGNRWNYETLTPANSVSYHFNEITKDTMIQNEKWFVLAYDTLVNSYFINKADGLWFLSENGQPVLYYKNPAVSNDTYITSDSTHIKIVSNNEKIEVKAGTFNCIHYDTYNKYFAFDEYWAPGYGLIKLIKYQLNTNKQIVLENTELISYTLK